MQIYEGSKRNKRS